MVGFGKMSSNTPFDAEKRNKIFSLKEEQTKKEEEIRELNEILAKNNVGMNEPLVDNEGFPRNDIDVYQVRIARHKIICLRNDLKSIMKQMEMGLNELFGSVLEDAPMEQPPTSFVHTEPFAKVTLVSPSSPADISGLKTGDLLLEFGSVNKSNFTSMENVAAVVRYPGQKIDVVVKRQNLISIRLELVLRRWSGHGLLGCKIDPLPIEAVER